MQDISECSKRRVVDMLYGNQVLKERVWTGSSPLDKMLQTVLMGCRNEKGCAIRPISYYSKIRKSQQEVQVEKDDVIRIQKGSVRVVISLRPYLTGTIEFHDRGDQFGSFGAFQEISMDVAERIMDKYEKCPTIVDEASVSNTGCVRLTWHHCHYHDLSYHASVGYFVMQKTKPIFLWDYTLHGPAQVYREALELIQHFHLE